MSNWQERHVPLRFRVGDATLFSIELDVLQRGFKLGEGAMAQADPWPAERGTDLPAGHRGWMLRAQPLLQPLPRLSRRDGMLRYAMQHYRHCYIDLGMGFEAYRQKFSAKTRSTIQRKIRRFQDHCGGNLTWKSYRTVDELKAFHGAARALSSRTYQERLLDEGLPEAEAFVQSMNALAERDAVRAFMLFDGERAVSYLYCPVDDGVLIYAYLGYDPEYLKLSVGTVLQWLALESLFAENRFSKFDFTEGESDHKRLFATHELLCANLLVLRDSLTHRALLRTHAAFDDLSSWIGQVAQRLGLKAYLRKWLRHGSAARAPG